MRLRSLQRHAQKKLDALFINNLEERVPIELKLTLEDLLLVAPPLMEKLLLCMIENRKYIYPKEARKGSVVKKNYLRRVGKTLKKIQFYYGHSIRPRGLRQRTHKKKYYYPPFIVWIPKRVATSLKLKPTKVEYKKKMNENNRVNRKGEYATWGVK